MEPAETLEQAQARHRRELKELQGRITSKKKNASKKTRKGVNDECAGMEREMRERHEEELAALTGAGGHDEEEEEDEHDKDEAVEGQGEQQQDELAKATEKLTVSGSEQQQQQQQQPAKKRNRQKERLARRAADQEAAAVRAEQEAAGMTDHRARESDFMKKTFAAEGLVEQDIQPDGHCLFSAVADQLRQRGLALDPEAQSSSSSSSTTNSGEPDYKVVRRAATSFMLEHADDFAPFLEEDLEGYAQKMRNTAEWGGQLELTALARRYGAEIRVVQDGRLERIGEDEGKTSGTVLWLAYYRHGYGLGEHYNSLRKAAA